MPYAAYELVTLHVVLSRDLPALEACEDVPLGRLQPWIDPVVAKKRLPTIHLDVLAALFTRLLGEGRPDEGFGWSAFTFAQVRRDEVDAVLHGQGDVRAELAALVERHNPGLATTHQVLDVVIAQFSTPQEAGRSGPPSGPAGTWLRDLGYDRRIRQRDGGSGEHVELNVIEFGWDRVSALGGAQLEEVGDRGLWHVEHGVRTLGILAAAHGGPGEPAGIVPDAKIRLCSPQSQGQFDEGAIANAITDLLEDYLTRPKTKGASPRWKGGGNVLLIQLEAIVLTQSGTPVRAPAECIPALWALVATAVKDGLVVVTPTGNGVGDLSKLILASGSRPFDHGSARSGALLVTGSHKGGPSWRGASVDARLVPESVQTLSAKAPGVAPYGGSSAAAAVAAGIVTLEQSLSSAVRKASKKGPSPYGGLHWRTLWRASRALAVNEALGFAPPDVKLGPPPSFGPPQIYDGTSEVYQGGRLIGVVHAWPNNELWVLENGEALNVATLCSGLCSKVIWVGLNPAFHGNAALIVRYAEGRFPVNTPLDVRWWVNCCGGSAQGIGDIGDPCPGTPKTCY